MAGFGTYRYQVSSNDASKAMNGPLGSFDYNTSGTAGLNGFYGFGDSGRHRLHGHTWRFERELYRDQVTRHSARRQSEWHCRPDCRSDGRRQGALCEYLELRSCAGVACHSVAEISYVGSASRNQLENGQNGHINDANPVAYGAIFTPDPKTGLYENLYPITGTGANINDWRPADQLRQHLDPIARWLRKLQLVAGFAAQKQSGNLYMFTNFTFGKVLGTRDGSTSNGNGNGSGGQSFQPGLKLRAARI